MSKSQEYLEELRCRRSLWVDYELLGTPLIHVVNERRRCPGFLGYNHGLSPEQNMERLSKSEERKAQFWYLLAASVLAAVLTLVGQTGQQWLAKHLGLTTPTSTSVPEKK
jgi:hypothetical protein